MRRLGIAFTGQPFSIREIVAAAQEAERLGYDSIWIAEDFWTGRDAVSVLACLALSTERIKLGTCVINISNRHTTVIAMTFNTLSDLARDRLIIGIGAGGRTLRAMASSIADEASPVKQMRETVASLRTLLTGGEIVIGGERIRLGGAENCFKVGAVLPVNAEIPIYIGASGPHMTTLTGEIADGLIFEIHTRPDQIPERRAQIRKGAERASRSPERVDIAAAIVAATSHDGKLDEATLCWSAGFVARLSDAEIDELGFDRSLSNRIRDLFQQGDHTSAAALLRPEMIDRFAVTGTAREIHSGLDEYTEAGVDLPILVPFGGEVYRLIQVGADYIHQR